MEKQIEHSVDKSSWGPGAWQNEPDRKEWVDAATGFPCLAHRNEHGGNWCGYVAVPPGHPAHGKDYDDVDVSVHGGLTYANQCSGNICHVPALGEPENVYWLGFDCHHCNDLAPGYASRHPTMPKFGYDVYRTLEYVEAECASLAAQLKNL